MDLTTVLVVVGCILLGFCLGVYKNSTNDDAKTE